MCQIPQTASSCIRPGWLCQPTGTWGQRKGDVWPWRKELALDPAGAGASSPCTGCLYVSSVVSQDRPTQIPPWRQVSPNSSKVHKEENIPETLS